ncbi:hypothetical protein EI94DRAFT_1701260 [Lactarius quietus]|nr:hypothetical protein EI94DRAFT_1701260 [Lactarius quietus]
MSTSSGNVAFSADADLLLLCKTTVAAIHEASFAVLQQQHPVSASLRMQSCPPVRLVSRFSFTGWRSWSNTPTLFLCCCLLSSDNHKPLPSSHNRGVAVEQAAFGSLWAPTHALLGGQVGEEESGERCWSLWSNAPTLLFHCCLLTTIGRSLLPYSDLAGLASLLRLDHNQAAVSAEVSTKSNCLLVHLPMNIGGQKWRKTIILEILQHTVHYLL